MELKKVFIVDDDVFSLSWYSKYINDLGGYEVCVFDNPLVALNSLDQKPLVIFLDQLMPQMGGVDFLKLVRRRDSDILVVLCSGQESIQVAVEAMKYGAFDYIVKGEGDLNKILLVLNRVTEFNKLLNKG